MIWWKHNKWSVDQRQYHFFAEISSLSSFFSAFLSHKSTNWGFFWWIERLWSSLWILLSGLVKLNLMFKVFWGLPVWLFWPLSEEAVLCCLIGFLCHFWTGGLSVWLFWPLSEGAALCYLIQLLYRFWTGGLDYSLLSIQWARVKNGCNGCSNELKYPKWSQRQLNCLTEGAFVCQSPPPPLVESSDEWSAQISPVDWDASSESGQKSQTGNPPVQKRHKNPIRQQRAASSERGQKSQADNPPV